MNIPTDFTILLKGNYLKCFLINKGDKTEGVAIATTNLHQQTEKSVHLSCLLLKDSASFITVVKTIMKELYANCQVQNIIIEIANGKVLF